MYSDYFNVNVVLWYYIRNSMPKNLIAILYCTYDLAIPKSAAGISEYATFIRAGCWTTLTQKGLDFRSSLSLYYNSGLYDLNNIG